MEKYIFTGEEAYNKIQKENDHKYYLALKKKCIPRIDELMYKKERLARADDYFSYAILKFMKLWESEKKYKEEGKLIALLIGYARGKILNDVKLKYYKQKDRLSNIEGAEEKLEMDSNVEYQYIRQEISILVQGIMKKFEEENFFCAKVIQLRFEDGEIHEWQKTLMKLDKISEEKMFEGTPDTFRKRGSRCIQSFRKLLIKNGYDKLRA